MPDNNNPSLGTPCEACTEIRETEAEAIQRRLDKAIVDLKWVADILRQLTIAVSLAIDTIEIKAEKKEGEK